MADSTTIARPYAKAIFAHALAENKLAQWSEYLFILSQIALSPQFITFVSNPASTNKQHKELLETVCAEFYTADSLTSLINLLVDNKRLMLLPEISALYELHRAEQEKTLDVEVISFAAVSENQQQQLITSLSQRLQRKILLHISIDSCLLGGAIIRAGDLVIDGSVRGKLNKLGANLAA